MNKQVLLNKTRELLFNIISNETKCKQYVTLCKELNVNVTKANKEVRYYIPKSVILNELDLIIDIFSVII